MFKSMAFADFHTHTTYSDGRHTPEEMVQTAIEMGCYAIGLSGHSPMPFEDTSRVEPFKAEVRRLREAYHGKIDIYLGIEYDWYYSPISKDDFDYLIASIHYMDNGGVWVPTDWDLPRLQSDLEHFYGGDFLAFARHYYELIGGVADEGPVTVGHFDVISKNNRDECLFAEDDPKYLALAFEAVDRLCEHDAVFEVNTGAMFRYGATRPYPSIPILRLIRERGAWLILAGDAHERDALCYRFAETMDYIKEAGFTSVETLPPMWHGGRND